MRTYNKQIYEPVERPIENYYAEIAERTRWNRNNPPYIVFGLGTARTGTTASLNVFRGSIVEDRNGITHQIPVAYQHFKAGLRHAMLGWQENENWEFQIPDEPVFYMKDTIGPYTQKESQYNPLKIFDYMGYPKNKLFTIFYYRDPLDILSSWIDKWGSIVPRDILVSHFIIASKTLVAAKDEIETQGLDHATFLYECIRDNTPKGSANALFDRINQSIGQTRIISTETTTSNWDRIDRMGWKPDQPHIYEIPRIDNRVHHDARTKTSWEYRKKTSEELAGFLLPDEVSRLKDAGLENIYETFRLDTRQTLELQLREFNSFSGIDEAFGRRQIERR